MFCSQCKPAEPEVPELKEPAPGQPPPISTLPLRLVATNITPWDTAQSIAIIYNTTNDKGGAYKRGDNIPAAGPVREIGKNFVDFENLKARRLERLTLIDGQPVAHQTYAPPVPQQPTYLPPGEETLPGQDQLMAEIDQGIKKTGENAFEVERAVVEKVLSNPLAMRGVRIRPELVNGAVTGFRVAYLRPNAALARIGVQLDDVVQAINGMSLTSADKALEVYAKLREANSIQVSVIRNGTPITVNYRIK
jgi:type II secretion system protein C